MFITTVTLNNGQTIENATAIVGELIMTQWGMRMVVSRAIVKLDTKQDTPPGV